MAQVIDLLQAVAQKARRCPDPTLIEAYVGAARRFCRETRFVRENVPGQTVIGQALYSLGSDALVEIINVQSMSARLGGSQAWPVLPGPQLTFVEGPAERPRFFKYVPDAHFCLQSNADAVYDLTIEVAVQPRKTAVAIPDVLVTAHDKTLDAGALSYLLDISGQAWTDHAEAKRQEEVFKAGINNARNAVARQHTDGRLLAVRRPFLAGAIR